MKSTFYVDGNPATVSFFFVDAECSISQSVKLCSLNPVYYPVNREVCRIVQWNEKTKLIDLR